MDPRIIATANANIAACGVTFPAARTRIKAKSFIVLEQLLHRIVVGGYPTIFPSLQLGHLGIFPLIGSGQLPSSPIKKAGGTVNSGYYCTCFHTD